MLRQGNYKRRGSQMSRRNFQQFRNNNNNNNGANRLHNVTDNATLRIYRRMNRGIVSIPRPFYAPQSLLVTLAYLDATAPNRNNAGIGFLSWRYRINSAYDPDPLVLSGAIPGFTEWAAFYQSYRVMKLDYDITICNKETFALDVVVASSNADLGANYINTYALFSYPGNTNNVCGTTTGNDHVRLTGSIDPGKVFGQVNSYLGNDGFASATNTNPLNLLYINIGALCPAAFVNGVFTKVMLFYTISFFTVKTITT